MQLSNHWRLAGHSVCTQAIWGQWVLAQVLLVCLLARIQRQCSSKRKARLALRKSQPMAMRLRLLQQALRQLRWSSSQTGALAKCSGEASPLAVATCAPPQSKVDTAILEYEFSPYLRICFAWLAM